MKTMIRDGSSAKNLSDLWCVGGEFLVSDDKHPEDLLQGHLDQTFKDAVEFGMDPVEAVRMISKHPAEHYGLSSGVLAPGRAADLVIVDSLEKFNIEKVIIDGSLVARDGNALFDVKSNPTTNTFSINPKKSYDFEIFSEEDLVNVRVIKVLPDQILTLESDHELEVRQGKICPDIENDVLKIAVVNRYQDKKVSNAFVNGFKLVEGAIASSVAHDSHNIIVVGTDSNYMADAVNIVARTGGGMVALSNYGEKVLSLPVAGLMSTENVEDVSYKLKDLHNNVKNMGCDLDSPFMTMSFLALLVIPKLKLSDMGLFDGESFKFVDVIK
jgi:adenine deaminase